MGALTIRDLEVVAGEPRVADIVLGERLGFDRPRDIRKIIARNQGELHRFGFCATVAQNHGGGRGRPGRQYWLNEGQALLICMFSDTDRAADVREQLIKVFMAWRRGELVEGSRDGGATPLPPMAAAIEALVAQTQRLVAYLDNHERLNAQGAAAAIQHAAIVTRPGYKRLSSIELDPEVAGYAAAYHRAMTIHEAVERIALAVGKERAPSRSALQRHWMKLDRQYSGGVKH